MKKPLEGLFVVEMTSYWAATTTARFLRAMGARVVKIETPPIGDACRYYGRSMGMPITAEENPVHDIFNGGKECMRDCGLFVSTLEDGTQYDILRGNLYGYKGAIFENLIADIFAKMGRKLYYFHKDSGLEVDFVIRYHGECVPVEVKANTGNTKSTKTILRHPEKYHVQQAIKLGDYNVGRNGPILTLPLYMAFPLRSI